MTVVTAVADDSSDLRDLNSWSCRAPHQAVFMMAPQHGANSPTRSVIYSLPLIVINNYFNIPINGSYEQLNDLSLDRCRQ